MQKQPVPVAGIKAPRRVELRLLAFGTKNVGHTEHEDNDEELLRMFKMLGFMNADNLPSNTMFVLSYPEGHARLAGLSFELRNESGAKGILVERGSIIDESIIPSRPDCLCLYARGEKSSYWLFLCDRNPRIGLTRLGRLEPKFPAEFISRPVFLGESDHLMVASPLVVRKQAVPVVAPIGVPVAVSTAPPISPAGTDSKDEVRVKFLSLPILDQSNAVAMEIRTAKTPVVAEKFGISCVRATQLNCIQRLCPEIKELLTTKPPKHRHLIITVLYELSTIAQDKQFEIWEQVKIVKSKAECLKRLKILCKGHKVDGRVNRDKMTPKSAAVAVASNVSPVSFALTNGEPKRAPAPPVVKLPPPITTAEFDALLEIIGNAVMKLDDCNASAIMREIRELSPDKLMHSLPAEQKINSAIRHLEAIKQRIIQARFTARNAKEAEKTRETTRR